MVMQDYEVQDAIGQGQYGTAYKARHRLDGQLYCIKRIGLSAKDDQSGALKEVQLLSQLDHPNIIGYKESFIDPKDGALCIATTFCEEGDLFNRIRKRQQANQYFSENEVMDMFVQIASALLHIHNKRILHRDLKTQNIFIAKGNIIKLGDFGISKVLEKTDQFATTVTGTPYYMAPEICTNQPYTFKSDIWSLGCVLYELCTLKHAFAADSLLSLVYQIVRGNFPPIPANQFSKGLNDLVNGLLVRDAAQRPSLSQIFQMPFVLEHLHRYNSESKKSLIKHSNTMAKRRQLLEKTQGTGSGTGSDAGDDASLTPKQRLERKKEADRRKRELELQLANINNQKERGVAGQRKAANIQGSNLFGLPGSAATAPVGGGGGPQPGLEEDVAMTAISAAGRLQTPSAAATPAGADDTMVNMGTVLMGTMPNMGTMPAAAMTAGFSGATATATKTRPRTPPMAQAGQTLIASTTGRGDVGNQTMYQAYDNRAVGRPRTPPTRAPGQLPAYNPADDDGVMLGTVQYGNTMVNMGTVNLGGQSLAGTRATMGKRSMQTTTARAMSSQSDRTSTVRTSLLTANPPPPPANIVNGFKFGVTQTGTMPSLPAFPSPKQRPESPIQHPASPSPTKSPHASPPQSAKIRFGISTGSQPRGSFEYAVRDANNPSSPEPDYEEIVNDYESDFEDYNPADDQDTISQKCKILNNMEDLERSRGKVADNGISQVRERVGSAVKNSKATQLRTQCQAALGFHFAEVYTYLRRTRTQDPPPDEASVQKTLSELVGGDKTLMQGCFLVDQLVFTELLYA